MAVTSRELHKSSARRSSARNLAEKRRGMDFGILRAYSKPIAVVAVAYVVLLFASGRATIWLDDLRYGRPRTMQIEGLVGHNEATGNPTRFVAMNLDRRVVVMELPGGDASKTQILQGPYLFGADEHLTPVRLQLNDVNGDTRPDLIISVKNEEIIYINAGETYRLINDEERQQIAASR